MAWDARNLISTLSGTSSGEGDRSRLTTLAPRGFGTCVEIKFRAPHAIDATCFRSCVCAMAWRFHAIDATLSPWPRQLDGVEVHEGPRNISLIT